MYKLFAKANGTMRQYDYQQDFLQTYFGKIKQKRIYYKDIQTVVISNAVHTVKGGSISAQIPLYKTTDSNDKTQYAYITLFGSDKIRECLQPEMTSLEVLWTNDMTNVLYGTVCQNAFFLQLLEHCTPKIYILEDVYLRFSEEYKALLPLYGAENGKRTFIVTAKKTFIPLYEYSNTSFQ